MKIKKCRYCAKSFSTAQNLKAHRLSVHDQQHKENKCESCGKSFTEAGSLKKHIYTIHKGHKDYKCESCGKLKRHSHDRLFAQVGNLTKHIHVSRP